MVNKQDNTPQTRKINFIKDKIKIIFNNILPENLDKLKGHKLSFIYYLDFDEVKVRQNGIELFSVKGIIQELRNSKNSITRHGMMGVNSNWNLEYNQFLPNREDKKRIKNEESLVKSFIPLYWLFEDNSDFIAMKIRFGEKIKLLTMKKWNNPDSPNRDYYVSFMQDGSPEYLLDQDYNILEKF